MPALVGIAPVVLVRWLYRQALEDADAWFPLVHVEPQRFGDAIEESGRWDEIAALAAGGWLFLGRPAPARVLARLTQGRQPGPARIIVGESAPAESVPAGLAARLESLDRFHLVATDPTLADTRRSLASQCRGHTPVHLAGANGTGKRSLVGWVHARLDDRPLSRVSRASPARPVPGEWALFEEVAELPKDALTVLRERLRSLELAPPELLPYLEPRPRPAHRELEPIVGSSAALVAVLEQAVRIAPTSLSALLLGEPGVGKELLARAVHQLSGRPGAFVTCDLASVPEDLVDSELFGHRRGAFTGAVGERPGAVRSAERGTLFLDEIGNVSPRVQAKLLRLLQEKRVRPVGEDRDVPVDLRVIAATNADLLAMVDRGEFREDLLQRLSGAVLRLPALRQRKEDVPLLARAAAGVPLEVSPEAMQILTAHPWPGNVRELYNVVQHALAMAGPGQPLEPEHLGPLAPSNHRPTPLITTSDGQSQPGGIERSLLQRMTAVTLHVPPLRDRGPLAVRSALLALLDGRPVSLAALALLERRPWWGELPELCAAAAAIRANLDLVDVPGLERALPHLLHAQGAQPIRVLLSPTVGADGRVSGLQAEFFEGSLAIGRQAPELKSRPAFLALPHVPRLSRQHLLVSRDEQGLVVHRSAGSKLPVRAGRLQPGAELYEVEPGHPVSLASAGEIQVFDPAEDEPVLQLFLFAGAVAFEQHAPLAAQRVPVREGATLGVPDAGGERLAVWTLTDEECRALTEVVVQFQGIDFKAHLEGALRPRMSEPALARLARYVLGPRPTQYCARLYEHPSNGALRAALAEALRALPDAAQRLDKLPLGIRRCLEPRSLPG
jgi:hypothetical protein